MCSIGARIGIITDRPTRVAALCAAAVHHAMHSRVRAWRRVTTARGDRPSGVRACVVLVHYRRSWRM